jgi:hypothetical protein
MVDVGDLKKKGKEVVGDVEKKKKEMKERNRNDVGRKKSIRTNPFVASG